MSEWLRLLISLQLLIVIALLWPGRVGSSLQWAHGRLTSVHGDISGVFPFLEVPVMSLC